MDGDGGCWRGEELSVDAMGTMAVVMQLQEGGEVVGGGGIARDGEGAVVLGCGVQLKRSSGGVL